MATRRKTAKVDVPVHRPLNGDLGSTATTMKSHLSASSSAASTLLPTVLETLLFLIYPATLLLGSVYSTFHPTLRAAPYFPDAQSYEPASAPSYFAKKSNVFNLYFVKIGWLWMTFAFFLLILTHPSHGPPLRLSLTRRRAQAALRYLTVTATWFGMTQWFFGAPIIDRSFRWTGGQCAAISDDGAAARAARAEMGDVREVVTHAACKAIGGTWRGGHDISGHVFLLILGSAMLLLEVLPAISWSSDYREPSQVIAADGSVVDAASEMEEEAHARGAHRQHAFSGIGSNFALVVAGLSWWMLLMTAAYFHTWFEKLTGSLVAFAAIYFVYILPRAVPGLRKILGLPGY